MNIGQIVSVVVGALITYIIATTLVTQLITGTSTGDVLIQQVVPITAAAGVIVLIIRWMLK